MFADHADVAELVDARVSEARGSNPVMVRFHSSAPIFTSKKCAFQILKRTLFFRFFDELFGKFEFVIIEMVNYRAIFVIQINVEF